MNHLTKIILGIFISSFGIIFSLIEIIYVQIIGAIILVVGLGFFTAGTMDKFNEDQKRENGKD